MQRWRELVEKGILGKSNVGTFLSLVHEKVLNCFVQIVCHRLYALLVNLKHEVNCLLISLLNYFFSRWVKLDTFCALLYCSEHQYSEKHNQNDVKLFWQTHSKNVSIPDRGYCSCDEIKRSDVQSLV